MPARGSKDTPTLAAFVDHVWAPRARRRLAAKTWERDSIVYRRHIAPALGDRPIAAIDIEDLVEWQDGLERVRYQLFANSLRIGPSRVLTASGDALLVGLMAMTGCRPGEALALRWCDLEGHASIARRLSGTEIVEGTKAGGGRRVPLLAPLAADLAAMRSRRSDAPEDLLFRTPAGNHWVETDWRNYRRRHFAPALERVEAGWGTWCRRPSSPERVRESVAGLTRTRPYDLGRHTHSALMLASGISLQRLARLQGHGIRILDEMYSEQLAEFEDREQRIDPVREIERARILVWGSPGFQARGIINTQNKNNV